MPSKVETYPFGRLSDGSEVLAYKMALDSGVEVTVTDLGASLIGFCVADRHGEIDDVVLACADASELERSPAYFGATIGRVAGRIANARFSIDGREYRLTPNTPPHHLHGGKRGLARRAWRGLVLDETTPEVRFSIMSKDGDEGYPGNLNATLIYRLDSPARLTLTYVASADQPTPFNPTCHPYFNLDGHAAGCLGNHKLRVNGSHYTPIDAELIPTGKIAPVAGTVFDFTRERPIESYRDELPDGYDHNFVLDQEAGKMRKVAMLRSEQSGRILTISTDRPCIHLYTGNALDESSGKAGSTYGRHAGLALETQGFPDAINHETFVADILITGETFFSQTIFEFDQDPNP